MVSNFIWIPNMTKQFFYIFLLILSFQILSMHSELPPHSHPDYSQQIIYLSFKRDIKCQGFPTFPVPNSELPSHLYSSHTLTSDDAKNALLHIPAYLSHTLWSLLESCSIDHSLYSTLPHLLLFTTSHSTLK